MDTGIIIVAGGSGQRCGGGIPKQFKILGGRPVLALTIDAFVRAVPEARIVVVLPSEWIGFWRDLSARFEIAPHRIVEGGATRFHSVRNGLSALSGSEKIVAVQDAVRPLPSAALIRRTLAAAALHGAAVPVVAPVDSFRETTDGTTSHPVDRSRLRIVQTPQAFRAEVLSKAYEASYDERFTDDASVVEAAGYDVCLCEGERSNLKITTPEDFAVAEALLARRDADTAEHLPLPTDETHAYDL